MASLIEVFILTVPSAVQNILIMPVNGMVRRLKISWDEPTYPNAKVLHYTILITNLMTDNTWNRTIGDKGSLSVQSETLGKIVLVLLKYSL